MYCRSGTLLRVWPLISRLDAVGWQYLASESDIDLACWGHVCMMHAEEESSHM